MQTERCNEGNREGLIFCCCFNELDSYENKRFEWVFDEFKDISDFIVANRVTDEINLLQERR